MKTVTTLVNHDTMTAYLQKQMSRPKSMDARDIFEIINELHFSQQNWLENMQEMPVTIVTTYHSITTITRKSCSLWYTLTAKILQTALGCIGRC